MYNSDNKICHKSMDASNSETPKQQQGTSGMPLKSWIQATARKQFDHSNDRKVDNSMALVISYSRNGSNSRGACNFRDASKSRDVTKSRKASNWMDAANSRKVKKTWNPAKEET
jgi:hypothetical protein